MVYISLIINIIMFFSILEYETFIMIITDYIIFIMICIKYDGLCNIIFVYCVWNMIEFLIGLFLVLFLMMRRIQLLISIITII